MLGTCEDPAQWVRCGQENKAVPVSYVPGHAERLLKRVPWVLRHNLKWETKSDIYKKKRNFA